MPCPHKFLDDLNLGYVDYKIETLIVGTFNPEWPENNQAEWFYGRTHDQYGLRNNSFWDVLPRVFGDESLLDGTPQDWKSFCAKHGIALTDLICCINDAVQGNHQHEKWLGGYSDTVIAKNFKKFQFTDIKKIIEDNPTIKSVYLTRGLGDTFWRRLWGPIKRYCDDHGIECENLLTPSKNARFSMFSWNSNNPDNPFNMGNLNDYVFMKWQQVFNNQI